MSTILFALAPFIVSGLTALIKRLPVIDNMSDGKYTWIVRFIAAVLSFMSVIGIYMTNGQIDTNAVNTFVLAMVTFLGATGVHFFTKPK